MITTTDALLEQLAAQHLAAHEELHTARIANSLAHGLPFRDADGRTITSDSAPASVAALLAKHAGAGVMPLQKHLKAVQSQARQHPAPTGRFVDGGGSVVLLALGACTVPGANAGYGDQARPGDLFTATPDYAERLVRLGGAREV